MLKNMKITFCGSMHHYDTMLWAGKELEKLGYELVIPRPIKSTNYDKLSGEERAALRDTLIREHMEKIGSSDAILVINEEKNGVSNYIGGNTLMEMAFAYSQGIEIFLLNPAPKMSYADEITGMRPIVLHGSIKTLDEYFKKLPKTFVSSKSPIKLLAVSRGMRRAGIRTQVLPHPTQSNVNEQPQSIEETYEGAENRHDSLVRETINDKPAYLATVESGNHLAHPKHNYFASTVVVLEKVGTTRKTGINMELELPKTMTDKVPSKYPDIGVLVQKEYGSTHKDPFPYFTNGKITRLQLVENAVFGVAVQLLQEEK